MKLLREILLQNFVIKIVALILAVLTWIYITSYLYEETSIESELQAPSIIKVSSAEKLVVKKLPIYVNIEGTPDKNYKVILDRIVVSPATSVVAGPPEIIKDLSYITTVSINVDNATSTVRERVELSKVSQCKIGYDGLVSVTIPIAKKRVKR
ncbi:MAG: hypothetical protein ABIB11_01260 [Candidatus Omnitrophota bacterium]